MFSNAPTPTVSGVFSISKYDKFLQFAKAPSPITIILSGNTTVSKESNSAQALLAITLVPSLTLISLPLFSYFISASPTYIPFSSSKIPLS